MNQKPQITYVCGHKECGSLNVVRGALAKWNVKTQQWEVGKLLKRAHCNHCEAVTELVELPIEGGQQ